MSVYGLHTNTAQPGEWMTVNVGLKGLQQYYTKAYVKTTVTLFFE